MPGDKRAVDQVVADAQRSRAERERSYREQALKMYPWICGRCAREFDHRNLHELTVHHRDHNHDNNPADGSNWELLCVYCHDNEHARLLDTAGPAARRETSTPGTHRPFSGLADRMRKK